MKKLAAFVIALAALTAGCSSSNGPDVGDTDTSSGNGNPGGENPQPHPTTVALFQPLQGVLPFPTDLYFAGSTDGTLNIQPANALSPNQSGLNQLDGFSTTAVIRAKFASAIDSDSLTASSVRVVQVQIDNSTKATVGVVRPLVIGTDPATADVSVGLAADAGVGNTILEIRPLKPLVPSTGLTNNGYLVLLTDEIETSGGLAATPSADYASIKVALPSCDAITNTSMNGICLLTGAHLQIAQALGIDPATVVLSFSFSTQATRDTMELLKNPALTTAQPIGVVNTGLTTTAVSGSLPGLANLYVGTFTIPYYLSRPTEANPTAPLNTPWQGNPSPLDAESRFLTRFNPLPVATETLQIPILRHRA